MARIRLEIQTAVGLLTVDLPSGVSGDPVVLNLRKDDGFVGIVECLSGNDRATCLDRALALVQSARRERIVAAIERAVAGVGIRRRRSAQPPSCSRSPGSMKTRCKRPARSLPGRWTT